MSGAAAEGRSYRRPAPPKVEDLLKAYIIDHGFQPGDRLPTEAAFGEALGVSRNAIREAMRSLQSLGILEIRHGYGAYLAEVSLPRLADGLAFWGKLLSRDGGDHVIRRIAEVRSLVEASLVTEVAGRLTEADFADLRESIEAIEAAAEQDQRAYDADRRFHEILYRPLDNWVLIGFLRSLWDSTREITQEQPPGPDIALAPRHHRAILEGLEAGDGAAAAEAMREHFEPMLRGDYES